MMKNDGKTIDYRPPTIIMAASACEKNTPISSRKVLILPDDTNAAGWREIVRAEIISGGEQFVLIGRGKPTGLAGECDGIVITDQINVSGENPLVGPNDDRFGPRFPDVSGLYNPEISARILAAGQESGLVLKPGVILIPVNPAIPTALEEKLIGQNAIVAVTRDVFAGAITVKHAGYRCAGLILFQSLAGKTVDNFLAGLN